MNWLYSRRKALNLTRQQLADRLATRGLRRSPAAIMLWEKGQSIPALSDPDEAIILAEALEWSVREMLIAAGYPIDGSPVIAPELLHLTPMLVAMPSHHRQVAIVLFRHICTELGKLDSNNPGA